MGTVYYNRTGFPIQAYLTVILDYLERGYYREREVEYGLAKRGKISWSKTIKTQRPVIRDDEAFYLDFVTRKNAFNENQLITLIHQYCVAESFEKAGWLFTNARPQKPVIKRNEKMFKAVLRDKLDKTFNDRNKLLFRAMLQIIDYLQNEDMPLKYMYGTYRFEYVWEALVDRVYGIKDKAFYFPKTTWKVKEEKHDNASLEPDTIMLYGKDFFVLDAKYYKYGATGLISDLPSSTSINKQITYGEYVANKIAGTGDVYNAFLMPFDSLEAQWNTGEIVCVGEATGNWRENDKPYEHIQGILVDVKYLMQITVREDSNEILRMAESISQAVKGSYRSD
ncbi:MAG: LlaJI family restriction endonuclease [Clostridiales bacterium]|nr:LlaJI family restriction endonuclease [Clostridiales bacterium]